MIKKEQEEYLSKLPEGKMVVTSPFNPRARALGNELVAELRQTIPEHVVHFGGAAALGIAGQNDIDILILSTPDEYEELVPVLELVYGPPSRKSMSSVKWELKREGFDIELYLANKNSVNIQEQLKVFEILSCDQNLRDEYEKLKLPYGPIDFKEYMRKKYAFFNKILGLNEE